MAEYDGIATSPSPLFADYGGVRIDPDPDDGICPLYSPAGDARTRYPDAAVLSLDGSGDRVGWVPNPIGADGKTDLLGLIDYVRVRPGSMRGWGLCPIFEGMFSERDKLARIGVVVTVSGVPLGNTDVILNGLNHREIVQTDHRGVGWKYLEIDEYPGALFISPNGITYDLLRQAERADNEGIFDQVVRRRTLANATSRQLHRKFV